ncbi:MULTISPECIES: DUF6471 domain-containing protein [Burkholderiaceae]|uniref:DUF6471 domain-containing protein n=1 Tax=Caballeronia zhejiangensis TaxID=871203 RepID=A0A656QHI6_9BURK|nr:MULTISPECIES: DUF6471 domain-containing protein [Burkholderiaceae]KAK43914.1 hypothetical protein BG58_28515 [Caballeronia jiangsuensis]KDR28790.1 hypothetical protein BG60_09220 [Caballeronia zhejiangensis]KWU19265.1 hypothetical protein AS149_13380 [Burkholderia cenocepacia]
MTDWYQMAGNVLRAELARQGVSYRQLARMLTDIGVDETERAIANKLSRGSFSFAFFLQCMRALGRVDVKLDLTHVPGKG